MDLRRKIVAHSDEEEMHFRAHTFPVLDGAQNFPHLQYDEGLHLKPQELRPLEELLHKLKYAIAEFIYHLAQSDPGRLNLYKKPESMAEVPDQGI